MVIQRKHKLPGLDMLDFPAKHVVADADAHDFGLSLKTDKSDSFVSVAIKDRPVER